MKAQRNQAGLEVMGAPVTQMLHMAYWAVMVATVGLVVPVVMVAMEGEEVMAVVNQMLYGLGTVGTVVTEGEEAMAGQVALGIMQAPEVEKEAREAMAASEPGEVPVVSARGHTIVSKVTEGEEAMAAPEAEGAVAAMAAMAEKATGQVRCLD